MIRVDKDSNKKGGGTAIIIKKNIKYSQIHINNESQIIEKSIINIKLKNNNKIKKKYTNVTLPIEYNVF